jgi:hypothetical protein
MHCPLRNGQRNLNTDKWRHYFVLLSAKLPYWKDDTAGEIGHPVISAGMTEEPHAKSWHQLKLRGRSAE